jgi:hypothetical protein
MRGVDCRKLKINRDTRGELVAFEKGCNLEFTPQRFFYIRVESSDAIRAGHATSNQEALIILTGAVTVDLDNGAERQTLRLAGADSAICIQSGVWVRLRAFAAGTLLLVAASLRYDETNYYDTPQPHLIPAFSTEA